MRSAILVPLVALVLAACASLGVKPGASEAEVARAFGKPPAETFEHPDGVRQLVFPTGPLGTQTFMVYMKNGTVQRSEQVLTDDTFYRINMGTTRDEVRRMLGPPWRTVRFDNLKQDAWDYRFRDTWGYLADFSVLIDDRGMVASKITVRIEPGRDGSGMSR